MFSPSEIDILSTEIARKVIAMMAAPEPEHITYKEAMEHLEIRHAALARVFYKVFKEEDEDEFISLHQIAKERNRSYNTVLTWIAKSGIKKYAAAAGRGKAIKRKDLRKLP